MARSHQLDIASLPFLLLPLLFILLTPHLTSAARRQRPHIVVILADDLGWNDVSFRNPERRTPNIDNMARAGVELKYSYMQQVCTPSRAAFMTGIYPFRMGLQNSVLTALQNASLPTHYPVLPERLQALGYSTHYVGKWHLGFCNYAMTPTRRGFDTFYGMYLGKAGYFNHTSKWDGYDLHDDVGPNVEDYRVAWEGNGTYSTHLFTDRAVQIVQNHDANTPLFLLLSYQAVHGPLEVPDNYTQLCQHIADADKKVHCAMTAAMDEGIGRLNQTLNARGFSDNLIMMFASDNGGPTKLGSSNWPLRGSKITLWEGGTRAVTLLHSSRHLPDAPYQWTGLIHSIDWFPTLLRAAGDRAGVANLNIDGVDSWKKIVKNKRNSARRDFVYNIDDVKNTSAIRYKKFKLINNSPGKPDGWYNPPGGGSDELPEPGPYPEYMLFNIDADPEERINLIDRPGKQNLINTMKTMLSGFQVVPTEEAPKIPAGKPKFHNGSWVTGWC